MVKTYETTPYNCPNCGRRNDLASAPGEPDAGAPGPGDALVCWGCGMLLTIDSAGHVRELSAEEFSAYPAEFQRTLQRYRQAILDKNFMNSRLRQFDSRGEAFRFAGPRGDGMIGVLAGIRCADGDPPGRVQPAKRVPCDECLSPIWLHVDTPHGVPACCAQCLARMLTRERQ